jgi:hypothetical protein
VAAKNNFTYRNFLLTSPRVVANTILLAATCMWPLIVSSISGTFAAANTIKK